MTVDPARTFAEHVCTTTFATLPEPAVTSTKHDILDTLGAALGGSGAPGIPELLGLVRRWGGAPESPVLLFGDRVPAPQAALVNAAMGHALDFDDTLDHGGSIHPGVSTLMASLAAAALCPLVSGQDLVLAVALGLDVSCRVALAATVDRGWHRTAAIGIFGATAAVGKLLGLSVQQMHHAFGIAYSQAAGNRQCILDGALTKRLQAGQAASSAVLAALLAQQGFTGAHDVFTGRFGFFPMYQPDGYDVGPLTADLGTVFRGAELSFKPYPCGRPTHAIIDAALALYRELDLRNADTGVEIAEVLVTTDTQTYDTQFAPGTHKRRPTHVVEAQFSVPFLIATALVHGRVSIGDVATVDHPAVLALSERMQGEAQPEASTGWARLTVSCTDGRCAVQETTTPTGSPERPLSDTQLEAKFRDCAANAVREIPARVVDRVMHLVRHLEDVDDVTEVGQLCYGELGDHAEGGPHAVGHTR